MQRFTWFILLIALNASAQPDLVGYYSFCNCNANDNSGQGNHGTLTGNPTCVPGQRGVGFLFNQNPGSNGCGKPGGEYVQLPAFDSIWQNGFTVCAWVRFDAISFFERIIDFGNGSGDGGGMPIWFGREGSSNNLTLESWITSNGSVNRTLGRLVAPNVITNGNIEYYCGTISGDTMRIYVNGVLKAQKKGHPILNVPRSNNFIGRSNWCFNDPDFKGFMDEVRIYNRALTEAEINSLYQQTPTFGSFQNPVLSGTPVQLQAQGGIEYLWSPSESLDAPDIPNPIATPYETTTYTCKVTLPDGCFYTDSLKIEVFRMPNCSSICTGALGENIFPNGDFGSGIPNILPTDPGLAPGYIYTLNPPPNDGYYCISNNTTSWGSFAANAWIDIEDNGPEPNGYMMVVNASYPPGLFYQKTVDVCENTPYEFSIDVISLIFSAFPDKIRPNISFLIDGISVCETGDIAPDEQWHTSRFSFITAPGQTTATLALRNNAPGGNGNDLAIDNISFRTCGPNVTVPPVVTFCKGVSATIHSLVTNSQYADPYYLWQTFSNGTWVDIQNSNADSLEILDPEDGSVFRLLIANGPNNIFMPNCRIVSDTIQMKQLSDPTVNTLVQDVSCAGEANGSVFAELATGILPYTYSWNSGESSSAINNLSAGTYEVTVTDAVGCTGVAIAIVSEPPVLTGTATASDVSCFDDNNGTATATITGGALPYTYLWSNGQTNAVLDDLSAGTYLATVTDANGCITITSAIVSEPPVLVVTATASDISCFGGNNGTAAASITGGVLPYTYLWSNGQTNAVLDDLAAGTYLATVTDANGCITTTSAIVSEPPVLAGTATASDVSCFGGNNGTAAASITGGVLPYTYLWSNGQTNAVLNNLSAGTYLATITDANDCITTTSFIVSEPPSLTATSTGSDVSCFGGNNGTATAVVSGGVTPYSYLWSNGQTNVTLSNLSAGIFQVTVTDFNACTALASVNITEPLQLSISAAAKSVSCFGNQDGDVTATALGGLPPFTYVWDNGQNTQVNNNLAAGIYAVTITDALGCTGVASASVSEPPLLAASLMVSDVSCFGGTEGSAIASVSGGTPPYGYVWSNGQTNAFIINLTAGTYSVSATDSNGCVLVGSVAVNQPPVLQLNALASPVSCYGGEDGAITTVINGGTSPYTYLWDNGTTTAQHPNLTAGQYSVTTTDAHGCTLTTQATVVQPAALISNSSVENVECHGSATGAISVLLTGGTLPYTFHWNTGANTAQITQLPSGTYTLSITDAHGCLLTNSAEVQEPPPLILQTNKTDILCFGDQNGALFAQAAGGVGPYALLWSNGQTTANISGLNAGTYTISLTDANGCSVSASENLDQPNQQTVELGLDVVIDLGDVLDLQAIVNIPHAEVMNYTWWGTVDSLQCPDCNHYSFQPVHPGCLHVMVRSKNGCTAIDSLCYRISPHRRVYAPNVFTPNGDGFNDFFTIFSDDGVRQILSLKIFNRWGGQIYQTQNIKTNDEPRGWDGTFKGQELNIDVFVWVAQIEFIDGQIIQMSGDVTLVR
ncbi:MAG: LamG-like jellyroll fold domain-containing protein [Saprospiraceae bacterium]